MLFLPLQDWINARLLLFMGKISNDVSEVLRQFSLYSLECTKINVHRFTKHGYRTQITFKLP